MATAPKFRIDVDIHNLLMQSAPARVRLPEVKGLKLPEPVFPRYPEKLSDPGPGGSARETPLERASGLSRDARLAVPLHPSRVMPGEFHPITRTYSWSTNAIWIAGTAGPTTTRSKG